MQNIISSYLIKSKIAIIKNCFLLVSININLVIFKMSNYEIAISFFLYLFYIQSYYHSLTKLKKRIKMK